MNYIETLDSIDWSDVPLTELKYKRLHKKTLDSLHPKLLHVINKMLSYEVEEKYDMCLLDVKVRDLKKGKCSCALPEYHYDWVKNYDHKNKHEFHLIYTNVDGTEFLHGGKCKDNSIYSFGRELHRGVYMDKDKRRVLVRLSYVDRY